MHVLGEAYNFALTKSPDARDTALRALDGLEMLFNVTGAYPFYPARSFCYIGEQGCPSIDEPLPGNWHESSTIQGCLWDGDTSSDEIDGHLVALPVIYDLVAQTEEEKGRVLTLIDGLTSGIVKNNLYLIDPTTSQPTTWGFWNPDAVNNDPAHYSERGANSLGILAFLASAYSLTRNTDYKSKFQELAWKHGYVRNALNVKIDNPDDDNHSDNELITLTFHTLFYAWHRISDVDEPNFKKEMWDLVAPLRPAAERTWDIIGSEFSPLWTAVFGGLIDLPISQNYIDWSVWTLRNWAADLVDWPIDQSQRLDVDKTPFTVRDQADAPIIRQIRPPSERQMTHWNNDPFIIKIGGGYSEFEPAIFRLPYFIMRFHGLLSSP
jgi:hypothetical protein